MSDLAEQILAAISTAEHTGRFGDSPVGFFVDGAEYHPDDVEIVYETGRAESDAVLRRCAADREIVEAARAYSPELEHGDNGEWAFDLVLRLLARGYGIQPTPDGDHA